MFVGSFLIWRMRNCEIIGRGGNASAFRALDQPQPVLARNALTGEPTMNRYDIQFRVIGRRVRVN